VSHLLDFPRFSFETDDLTLFAKDTEASTLAATLHQSLLPSIILESLPKSQIDLFVTILESDGWDGDVSMYVFALSYLIE